MSYRKFRNALTARYGNTALAAAVAPLLAVVSPVARLANHFGITDALAATIVTLIINSSWEIALFFPYVIPVEATVGVLVTAFGFGYAVVW
jgi:hypothetical protein